MCCSLLYPYIFPNISATFIKVTKDSQIAGIRAIRLQKVLVIFLLNHTLRSRVRVMRASLLFAAASEGEQLFL